MSMSNEKCRCYRIIPFVASDALDKPKDTMIDRKESIEYAVEETTPVDSESQIKKFSPPIRTEGNYRGYCFFKETFQLNSFFFAGGFVPRDPTLDELYFKTEYNRTHSTPSVPEITSEIRITQSYLDKVPEVILEGMNSSQSINHFSSTSMIFSSFR